MTAFDNIKTNNWPAASNDFEDFLVLKLPLNDNASLTESMPVVAGSQELFPKRTLTNSGGVSLVSAGGIVYSANGGGNLNSSSSWANVFNGEVPTNNSSYSDVAAVEGGNTSTITFSPALSGNIRVRISSSAGSGSTLGSITLSDS